MLFEQLEFVKYSELTEGQARATLLAISEDLNAAIANKEGNSFAASRCQRVAIGLRAAIPNLHNELKTIPYAQGITAFENNVVNSVISELRKLDQAAITMTAQQERTEIVRLSGAIGRNNGDEFDPTVEQIRQCRSNAATKARAELINSGRNFDPGTFDPNTQEVIANPDGTLVVISTAELATRTAQIFEACTSRMVMENIVNTKLANAGNNTIYAVLYQERYNFSFNSKVQERFKLQEGFIKETVRVTGLSEENIRLVLYNSVKNTNEEKTVDTLVKISQSILSTGNNGFSFNGIDPDAPRPTGLPTFPPDNTQLPSTQQTEVNFLEVIAKAGVEIIKAIVSAIRNKREDTYNQLPAPEVIAPRCTDSGITIAGCEGSGNNNGGTNTSNSNNGGVALLALGAVIALS